MKNRTMLRTQIDEAWLACIAEDYNRQRINSERSLQASFWSQLNKRLHTETRRMFIEPGMKSESDTRYPDIVICNTEKVIAIIELKYTPRAIPNWQSDLETFDWVVKHLGEITVSNKRFRGAAVDDHEYKLADDLVFVWAGIHMPSEERLGSHIAEDSALPFMELHHQTNVDVE
jgi:hypothetical protein